MASVKAEENQAAEEWTGEEEEVEEVEEEEEEETLLLVELHGVIDSEIFTQDSFGKFKVLAIDSDRPVLQMENFIFSGEYQHTVGTAVLFEEEEKRMKCDPVFCKKPPRMLRYACSTNKKLSMKRVFVSEKSGGKDVKRESVAGLNRPPQDSSDSGHCQESPCTPTPPPAPPDDMDASTEGENLAEGPSHAEQMQE